MAEEKIINEEEIMLDEELDNVAGGTYAQIKDDAARLRSLGYLPRHLSVSKQQVNDAFIALGRDITNRTGQKFSIGTDLSDDRNNKYYVNHDKKGHEEIWNMIYSKLGRSY